MDRRKFMGLVAAASMGEILSGWMGGVSVWAQTVRRTRTGFVDLEGRDGFDLGRAYGRDQRTPIGRRLSNLRENAPKECRKMLDKCVRMVRLSARREYDEIVGLGETMGLKPADVLLMGLLIPLWDEAAPTGSTLALGPKRTADGKTWLALNVDYPFVHAPFGMVVRRKLRKRPTTLTWSLAGGLGLAGVNSVGLAVTSVWLKFDGEGIISGVPGELIVRQVLAQKDFKGAFAVLADPEVAPAAASSFAVLLADSQGKMAVVERTHEHFSASHAPEQWLIHTNHFLDRGLARGDLGKKVFPDSVARYATLHRQVSRNQKFTVEQLKTLMSSHAGHPHGICRHDDRKTVASILLCPNDGALMVTRGNPCKAKLETFKLSDPSTKEED